MTRIDLPGGGFAEYRYDALGRRIQKNVNGQITSFIYDHGDILFEFDGAGVVRTRYTHSLGIDEPLLVQKDIDQNGSFGLGETSYYHLDPLGSVTEITDENGAVVSASLYDAYGGLADQSGALDQPYGFTGREFDDESGLTYYRARYYDPDSGRFISEDPIGLRAGDPNFYRYVMNNPLLFVDPLGWTAKCPCEPPPPNSPDWKPYEGPTTIFHCGFMGVLENRDPMPDDPQGECFYDDDGDLVDDNHPYAGCKGTPNQYPPVSIDHVFFDSGGIIAKGASAFMESRRYMMNKSPSGPPVGPPR